MRIPFLFVRSTTLVRRGRVAALVAPALIALAGAADAQRLAMRATIDGLQEVPPNASPATGTALFVLDRQANTLDYWISFSGLTGTETMAHIHGFAGPGQPGGILINLPLGNPKVGTWNFSQAQEANIVAGLTYVNIHSTTFSGGEIRGQIVPDLQPTTELSAVIDGLQEVPPNNSPATGAASFMIDTTANTLAFVIGYSGLTGTESMAHIHGPAAAGQPGGILFNLPMGNPKMGVWNYPQAQEANILAGLTYVNIHTTTFSGGEIRGQILAITNPNTYCVGKVNSQGCTPAISSTGVPSAASGPDTFFVTAAQVINNKNGIFFWGPTPAKLPFQGSTLCVQPPLIRTAPQNSGGNPPPNDCTGTYSLHFTQAYMATQGLLAGEYAYGQWWMRDPSHPDGFGVGFSNAIQFGVLP